MKKNYTLVLLMLMMSLVGHSQFFTEWQGTNSLWSNGANWSSGYGYGQLEFKGNGNTVSQNDLGTQSQWRLFFQGSQGYSLQGDAVELFDFGGQNSWILSQATGNALIFFDVSFSDSGFRPGWITTENTGDIFFNGNIAVAGNVTEIYMANSAANGRIIVNGVISGDEELYIGRDQNFNVQSTTSVEFTGANTYTADTFIDGGSLRTSGSGSLGPNADVFISASTILFVDNNLTVESIRERGSGNGGTVEILSGDQLTVNGNNKGGIFQNSINGTGDLVIETSGTTELSLYGNNNLSGTVTVRNGSTLKIIAGDGFPNADVVVENGGTIVLEGASEKGFGSLNVNTGGTVTMNGMSDRFNVFGDLINDGTINLSTTSGGDLSVWSDFTQNGTLNNNQRAVFFEGVDEQTLSGTSSPITFDFLRITKLSSQPVNINTNVVINCPIGTSGYEQGTSDTVNLAPGVSLEVLNGGDFTFFGGFVQFNMNSTSTAYSSLIVEGTVTGNITYNRYVNSNANGNDLVSPPVSGESWSDFLTNNASTLLDNGGSSPTIYAFGPFDKTVGSYVNYDNTTVATLDNSTGYRAATDSGATLAFTGSVDTGNVDVDIQSSGPAFIKWNLVGNPYPSYINVQDFLNHDVGGRTNLQLFDPGTAAIYGYDGDVTDGWKILNLATTTPSTVITPGQGFFVSADPAWVGTYDMQFTPAMRTTATGTPSEDDDFILGRQGGLVYMTLNINNGMGSSFNTDVYFNQFATLGFDLGFDAELFTVPGDFALYSLLVEEDEGDPYALQAVSDDDLANVVIPLGVNAPQGEQLTFTLAVNELPPTTEVYLDDTVENTSTLLNSGDYIITPTVQLFGTGRFFLRIEDDTLSDSENTLAEDIAIRSLNETKTVLISGQLKEDTSATIYDIQGRRILTTALDTDLNQNTIDVSALNSGIYVVSVKNNSQQFSQKVIIK